MNNTGGLYNGNTGSDIHINPAWNITSGAGIKVAVIDMGVDLTHPDLVNNLLPGYDALGQGTNGNQKGNDAHGTGCAGIIAAQANNNLGITGVAYNSKIIPIRVGQNGSLSTLSTANGINWAVNDGADILSCSFGGGSSNVELQAINNAIANGRNGKGCIVLASSGNDNTSKIDFPAAYSNVIAVGSTNPCDTRNVASADPNSCDYDTRNDILLPQGFMVAGGSNYGTGLGVVAPGVNISTTDIHGAAGFSALSNNEGWKMYTGDGIGTDYVQNFDGTSAACPFAAGVMALILSVNPNLSNTQATAILEQSANKVGGYNYSTNLINGSWNNEMGYGRVDACAAVLCALVSANKVNITGNSNFCNSSSYSINLPACTNVNWTVSDSKTASINASGNNVTRTKVSDGVVLLNATFRTTCSTVPTCITNT